MNKQQAFDSVDTAERQYKKAVAAKVAAERKLGEAATEADARKARALFSRAMAVRDSAFRRLQNAHAFAAYQH